MAGQPAPQPSDIERLKEASNYLRGSIAASLADPLTSGFAPGDAQLIKLHGVYVYDDRDTRQERHRRKLEPAYSCMIRVRLPGGVATPAQWLCLDSLSDRHGNGSIKLTTRQTFQLHGVLKTNLKATLAEINHALMTTIAACGDVGRNVVSTAYPELSPVHAQVYELAGRLSRFLEPRTPAYHELWLDGQQVAGPAAVGEVEPFYGKTYLPRKFKIGLAIPPDNEVDVYTQDLGFVAIVEDGRLAGFDVLVGGGMGCTHGNPATFPRLADLFGFCTPAQVLAVAEHLVAIQRDFGDRSNRKHARFKYTIADRGLEWLRDEFARRFGQPLAAARPFQFSGNGDRYGWQQSADGQWFLTLFIENGRVVDGPGAAMKTALREVARQGGVTFRITANQHLILGPVAPAAKAGLETLLQAHGALAPLAAASPLRRHASACVGLPTCALAMTESERYLPGFMNQLEALFAAAGLPAADVVVRLTGCPNGCARPYNAEIAFVGKGSGRFNLFLGGSPRGDRLNRLYRENLDEAELLAALRPLVQDYARNGQPGEPFGDFVQRGGYMQ